MLDVRRAANEPSDRILRMVSPSRALGICSCLIVVCALSLWTPGNAHAQDYVAPVEGPKEWYAELALERPEPRAEHGYPALDIDRRAVADLLLTGRFEELEDLLDDLAARTAEDIRWEAHLVEAYRAFERTDTAFADQLVRWRNARSGSAAPHFATARSELVQIERRRERGFLSPEPTEYYEGQQRLLRLGDNAYSNLLRASEALERGRAVDPDAYMGFLLDLEIAQQTGWGPRTIAILRDAVAQYPLSSLLREQAAANSVPGWGGTAAIVQRVVRDAEPLVAQNRRLAVLSGMEADDRARVRLMFGDIPEAMSGVAEALAAGPTAEFFLHRAGIYMRVDDYVRAVEESNQALALRPQYPLALQMRGLSLYEVSFHAPVERRAELLAAAVSDYSLLVELDPGDQTPGDSHAFLSERAEACRTFAETCLDGLEPSGPRFADGRGGVLGVIVRFIRDFYTYLYDIGLSPVWSSILLTAAGSFWLWRKSGYWLPAYVHVLAGSALVVILYINWLWMRGGGEMWTRRWVVITAFPLTVYFVFITFGGLKAAFGRRAPEK